MAGLVDLNLLIAAITDLETAIDNISITVDTTDLETKLDTLITAVGSSNTKLDTANNWLEQIESNTSGILDELTGGIL